MYTDQTNEYAKVVQEAIGTDTKAYTEKLVWLQNKWKVLSKNDSSETRLVASMILHADSTTPVNVAIIADNLAYFQKHAENEPIYNPEAALAKACLCGSRRIAEFLLQQLNFSFTHDEHDYLLGYVAASMQEEWMKEIALAMAQAKKRVPLSVYGLADKDTIRLIRKIFETGELPVNKPKI